MSDTIYQDEYTTAIPREPASDPAYVKHVQCEGARFHVLSWSQLGTHCSEPRCIINKRERSHQSTQKGAK